MNGSSFLIRYMCFRPIKRGDDTIYPIGLPISRKSEIVNLAIEAAEEENISKRNGFNGVVSPIFNIPEVVKHLYSPQIASKHNTEREIKALTALEINDIIHQGIQHGMYGYKNGEGDTYIVSMKLNGEKPDSKKNPFNTNNLSYLINIISVLDKPDKYWNHLHPNRPYRPISLAMHYDLKPGNILITPKRAGIVDFEYLNFIKLFPIAKSKQKHNWGIIGNYSDICGLPSNLRNFEYRTLLPYLEKCDNPKELFREYIKFKGLYYKNMAEEYSDLYKKLGCDLSSFLINKLNGNFKELTETINKQKFISDTLKNPDKDIIKSEAIKIQTARFIYLLATNSHGDKISINPNQIKAYITNAKRFFMEKANEDTMHRPYYQLCGELMAKWSEIIPILDNNNAKDILNYYRDISGTSDKSELLLKSEYTEEIQPTLDEIVI